MSITITPADVGRKVRLRNGARDKIIDFRPQEAISFQVETERHFYAPNGRFFEKEENIWDIVAFADEPAHELGEGSLIQGKRFPTDKHIHVWLTTFNAYLAKSPQVDHAADAANAAVEAFKKFEQGEQR